MFRKHTNNDFTLNNFNVCRKDKEVGKRWVSSDSIIWSEDNGRGICAKGNRGSVCNGEKEKMVITSRCSP